MNKRLYAYRAVDHIYVASHPIKGFDEMSGKEAASRSLVVIDVKNGGVVSSREGPVTRDWEWTWTNEIEDMDEEDLARFQRALHVEIAFRRLHKHADEELRVAGGVGLGPFNRDFRASEVGKFLLTLAQNNLGMTIGRI